MDGKRYNVVSSPTVITLEDTLSKYWGYTSFRPLQREAMAAILDGRDSVVVLPTGGGKSLCFQAPALVRGGLGLVVSPLISLMKDQVDTLVQNGVEAACYNSSLGSDRKAAVVAGIREGRYSLLYVSPERLAGEGSDSFLKMVGRVSYIAIDEAHCISQWGHDFRPEYRQIGACARGFPVSACTPSPPRRRRGCDATSRRSSSCATPSSSSGRSIVRIWSIGCCRARR